MSVTARSICRLCGSEKEDVDFDCVLNQIEADSSSIGGINFGDYINFYCRITLNPSPQLPRKVCKLCRLQVETFIAFCDNLSKVEKSIQNAEAAGFSSALIKLEPVKKEEPLFETSAPTPGKNGRPRNSMEHIKKLYEKPLSIDDSYSLEDFAHITVDRENVSAEGQISTSWLNQYNVQTWNDFEFKCLFCSETCKSLKTLLNHLKICKTGAGKIKFGCQTCPDAARQPFSSLNAYINHMTRHHEQEHLAYSCIMCCKSFYNIAYLIKHIANEHPRHPIVYPCIECGSYCQGLTALKTHIMSHKNQEVSDSSGDEEEKVPIASSTPKIKEEPSTSNHKKMSLSAAALKKRAKVFPCNVCKRVLLTKRGYDYHILVHANLKPFKCNRCPVAYRSKQDLDKHVLKHQM